MCGRAAEEVLDGEPRPRPRHRGRRAARPARPGPALTLAVLAADVVGALLSGSVALLADAGHVATDAIGLVVALGAVGLAGRPARGRRTYGWQRAEILAAAVNGLLLVGVGGYVVVEAVRRVGSPPVIGSGLMIGVAAGGLAVNLLCLALLHRGRDRSLNARGAYLEVLGDALGARWPC